MFSQLHLYFRAGLAAERGFFNKLWSMETSQGLDAIGGSYQCQTQKLDDLFEHVDTLAPITSDKMMSFFYLVSVIVSLCVLTFVIELLVRNGFLRN